MNAIASPASIVTVLPQAGSVGSTKMGGARTTTVMTQLDLSPLSVLVERKMSSCEPASAGPGVQENVLDPQLEAAVLVLKTRQLARKLAVAK